MVASDPSKFSSVVESEREPLTSLSSKDLVFIHLELHFQLCIPCRMSLSCSPCLLTPWDEQPLLPHDSINMMLSLTFSKAIEPANCGLKPRTKIKVSSFVVVFFFQYFMTVTETWLTQSYRWHFIFYWKNLYFTYLSI